MNPIYLTKAAFVRYATAVASGGLFALAGYAAGREFVPEEPFVGQFAGLCLGLVIALPLLLTYPKPKQVPVAAENRHLGLEGRIE